MKAFGLNCCSWAAIRLGGIKSTQWFLLATSVFLTLFVTVMCIGFLIRYEVETDVINANSVSYWRDALPPAQQVWFDQGIDELEMAMKRNNLRSQHPRNVLVFVVDGIGGHELAATRFLNAKNSNNPAKLYWDSFEQIGKLKNSCSNTEVCDAFTVGTALFGGVRTAFQVGGVDDSVGFRNCSAAANTEHQVQSVLKQALKSGLRAGFVTTRRVTCPLMAALYAHSSDTSWECDATIPAGLATLGCVDVAKQLLDLNAHVVMGGGRQTLMSTVAKSARDPIDERICQSRDGRNLVRDWQLRQLEKQNKFAVLDNADQLLDLNGTSVDRILGIYANGDLQRNGEQIDERVPLSLMVSKALKVLKRSANGYLFFVHVSVDDSEPLTAKTTKILQLHSLLKATKEDKAETLTLLLFTRGHFAQSLPDTSVETELLVGLQDAGADDDMLDTRYHNMITDTLVYAHGPQSQLFSGVREETYLAHAIAYVLRIGSFRPKP